MGAVADDCTTCHGSQIRDDLGDGNGVGGEFELIFKHERIQVLGAVGHEIETSHQKDKVEQENPVLLKRNAAFGEESACKVTAGVADGDSVSECSGLRQTETEDDDQDGRTGSEPVQRAPAVRSSIHQTTGKGCGEKVAERVTLL